MATVARPRATIDFAAIEPGKENVQPIKEGRRIADIHRALGPHGHERRSCDAAANEFERKLTGQRLGDRLSIWCDYLRWTRRNRVSDTHAACSVLISNRHLRAQRFCRTKNTAASAFC